MATAKEQLLSMMNPQQARLMDQQLRSKEIANRSQGAGMLSGLVQAYTGMADTAQRAAGVVPMGLNEAAAIKNQRVQQQNKEMMGMLATAAKSEDVTELTIIRDKLANNPTATTLRYIDSIQKKIDTLKKQGKEEKTNTKISEYTPYLREDFVDIEVLRSKRDELDATSNPTLIALGEKFDKKIQDLNKTNIQIVNGVAIDKNKLKHGDAVDIKPSKPILTDTQIVSHIKDGTLTQEQAISLRGSTDSTLVFNTIADGIKANAKVSKNPNVTTATKIVTDAIDEQLFINSPKVLSQAQELASKGDIKSVQVIINNQEKLKKVMEEKEAEAKKTTPKSEDVTLNPYSTADAIYVDYVEDKLKNISEENPNYSKMNELGMLPVVEYENGFWGDNAKEFSESFLRRQELTYDMKAFLVNNPDMTFEQAYQKALERSVLGRNISYLLETTTSTGASPTGSSRPKLDPNKQITRN